MLRLPNAARLLDGLSLSEVFYKYVLNDPDVVALAAAAVRLDHAYESVFREGQFPGPYVEFTWPLDVTAENLAFQFVRPIIFDLHRPSPKAPDAVTEVCVVMADRMKALRDLLTSGKVMGRGTFAKTGEMGEVDRLQWARRELWIDVQNSDLLETENHKLTLRWSGLIFEAPNDVAKLAQVKAEEGAKIAPNRKVTPQRASIEAAIKAKWPVGIPAGLPVQKRDQLINEWQREQGLAVTSSKTIRRHLAGD